MSAPTMPNYRKPRALPPVKLKYPSKKEAKGMTTAEYVKKFCELNGLKHG